MLCAIAARKCGEGVGVDITIQDITGERFLCGNEVPGLRERGCLVSFFPQS